MLNPRIPGFFSTIWYTWIDEILEKIKLQKLQFKDIIVATPRYEAAKATGRFDDLWNIYHKKHKRWIYVAFLFMRKPILWAIILAIGCFLLTSLTPIILERFLKLFEIEDHIGIYISCCTLFGIIFLRVVGRNFSLMITIEASYGLKNAIMGSVINKILNGQNQQGGGKLLNLAILDPGRIQDIFSYTDYFFSGPLSLLFVFSTLLWKIGVPALSGIMVVLLYVPIILLITRKTGEYRMVR